VAQAKPTTQPVTQLGRKPQDAEEVHRMVSMDVVEKPLNVEEEGRDR